MFSGIGGFEKGISQATEDKAECIGFSEIDKYAISIYEKHFGGHKNYGDAREIVSEGLPGFDLLVGGFPCQSFSIAGKRGGFEDTRGTLFFEIARIIKAKRPKLLLLENVKGLLSHDSGRTFGTILATLSELGYVCEWQVLNSKDFGVPQNRERVFIVGHPRGECRRTIFPIREDGEKVNDLSGQYTNTLTARYEKSEATGSYVVEGKQYAQEIIDYSSSQRKNHVEHRIKIGEANCLTTGKGCAGGMKSSTFVKLQNKNMRGKRIKDVGKESFTLGAGSGCEVGVLANQRIRRLTPKECERLQGFPDVEKYAIIKVCKNKNVNGAELSLNTEKGDNAVQVDVLIDCVENGVEILSREKSFLFAKNAEKKNWFHPHIKIDDFVQMLVGMTSIVEKTIRLGEVELHQSERCLTPQKNGENQEKQFGSEIMLPVGDVENDLTTLNELLKLTTLSHSSTSNLEQRLPTLSWFVIRAITGYIPKEILSQNTFTIGVKTKVGYTYGMSDSQRYKCLGNAVTVNVIEAIISKLCLTKTMRGL